MRIAVVMSRAEYEAREAVLAKDPDAIERTDWAFHNAASAIVKGVPGAEAVDLYVEADLGHMLTAEYLYTMAGDEPAMQVNPPGK